MKLYTVHIKQSDVEPLLSAQFVREGFSISAAIFQAFWALYNKMWLRAIILFSVSVAISLGERYHILSAAGSLSASLVFALYVGFQANEWKRRKLEKKGYTMVDVVAASGFMSAEQRFFDRELQERDLEMGRS